MIEFLDFSVWLDIVENKYSQKRTETMFRLESLGDVMSRGVCPYTYSKHQSCFGLNGRQYMSVKSCFTLETSGNNYK